MKVKGKAKIPDYIQLRDENLTLIGYFRPNRKERLDKIIKDLDDVDISGLQDGYILKWNDATNKWKVAAAGGGVGAGGTWASSSIGIHTTNCKQPDYQ